MGDLGFEVALAVQRIRHDESLSGSTFAGLEHAAVCRHVVIVFKKEDVTDSDVLNLTLAGRKGTIFEIVDDSAG